MLLTSFLCLPFQFLANHLHIPTQGKLANGEVKALTGTTTEKFHFRKHLQKGYLTDTVSLLEKTKKDTSDIIAGFVGSNLTAPYVRIYFRLLRDD